MLKKGKTKNYRVKDRKVTAVKKGGSLLIVNRKRETVYFYFSEICFNSRN